MIHFGELRPSKEIEDRKVVKLTWTERLLSKPWRPWVSTKEINYTQYETDAYGRRVCSLTTYQKIIRARRLRESVEEYENRN